MNDNDFRNFSKNIKGKIRFDYSLKNRTWLNIGGNAKIFLFLKHLLNLRDFLLNIKKKIIIFLLWAQDQTY